MPKPRIIFISHSASATGAPLIASSIVNYISVRRNWRIIFVFISAQSLSSLPSLTSLKRNNNVAIRTGLFKHLFMFRRSLMAVGEAIKNLSFIPNERYHAPDQKGFKCEVIYANSIVSLNLGVEMKKRKNALLVLHLHEMTYWIRRTELLNKNLAADMDSVDFIIAPTHHCIRSLQNVIQRTLTCPIKIIPEPSDVTAGKYQMARHSASIDENLQIILTKAKAEGRKVCICNGTDVWRKGLDHFLNIAGILNAYHKDDYFFLWISLPLSSAEALQVEIECEKLHIDDCINFLEPAEDFQAILRESDCYFLTSREDPMPVSALEAMSAGIPVVCFKDTGGVPDLLMKSPFQVVPYADVNSFAANVHAILADASTKDAVIRYQYEAIQKCSPSIVFESVLSILDGLFSYT